MIQIASVSLNDDMEILSQGLGASFAQSGFAIVRDHGIGLDVIACAQAAMERFFALPDEVKRAYHMAGSGGARGYTPFGVEQAKDADIQDLKEFWHVGRDLPEGDVLERFMPRNVWPEEVADFRTASLELFQAFEQCGARLLEAIALGFGLEKGFFAPTVDKGNSVLRLLHYPALTNEAAEGAIRASAHEDINTITLLLGAQEAGLQLLSRNGEWLEVTPPEGALVVNIGDMLQRLTGGELRSTTHRVVNPIGEAARRARYSMPFFLHFRPDYLIAPIAKGGERLAGGEAPITADDYLQERLREIGLA